jgi:hypothetical protein
MLVGFGSCGIDCGGRGVEIALIYRPTLRAGGDPRNLEITKRSYYLFFGYPYVNNKRFFLIDIYKNVTSNYFATVV